MDLNVVQVEGCYVSSSLPKALFVPTPTSYTKRDDVLYYKPKKKALPGKDGYSSDECPPTSRKHLDVQTDLYLEEICDVIEEADVQCQTDPALDRPTSPLFIPAKSGPDVATQIYPGDLFDFAEEVEPILEALVGQTLEQAIIEVMAEEELAVLSDLQSDYETRRNAELAEVKRLEEQERRLYEEKGRRLKEQEEAVILEDEIVRKIQACIFSQNYLSELVPQVYKKLDAEGYFDTEDADVKEIEEAFWPWLLNEVDAEIATIETSCQLLDSLIYNSVQNIAETSIISPSTPDFKTMPTPAIDEVEHTMDSTNNVDLNEEIGQSNELLNSYDEQNKDELQNSEETTDNST